MVDAPVVSVHIPLALRAFAGGHEEITASGETVGEVLDAVSHECPALRRYLLSPEGDLKEEIAVFLGARSVRETGGLATPIALEEVLSIVLVGGIAH
jgi:molybdopterin converting factor small subunit